VFISCTEDGVCRYSAALLSFAELCHILFDSSEKEKEGTFAMAKGDY